MEKSQEPHNNTYTKPIVYIDLIGTLAIWGEEIKKNPSPYTKEKEIFCGINNQPKSYDNSQEIKNTRTVSLLENYQEIIQELRQDCQLKLISTANRLQTLEINSNFNLGFDKREILSKEDLPEHENQVSANLAICPNAILISNSNKDAKLSIIKRQILGIEKEAQVELNFIELKCINQNNFAKQSLYKISENTSSDISIKDTRINNPSKNYPEVSI